MIRADHKRASSAVWWAMGALAVIAAMLLAAGASPAFAATVTWDGGGSTNNWSEGANWDTDSVPGATDDVVFDSTSSKDATVDANFDGRVNSLTITSGYTGTVTLGRRLYIEGDYVQSGGTFDVSASNHPLVADTINQSAGTFNPRSGVVILNSLTAKTVIATSSLNEVRLESPAESGLILYSKYDEQYADTTSKVAYDATGNGNNGTIAAVGNPTYSTNVPSGNASFDPYQDYRSLLFNGSTGYVDYGDVAALDFGTNPFTVAFFVRRSGIGEEALLMKDNWTPAGTGFAVAVKQFLVGEDFIDSYAYYSGSAWVQVDTVDAAGVNIWDHIAIVRESTGPGGVKLYRNGQLKNSTTDSRSLSNAFSLIAGASADLNAASFLFGRLDDVRVYNAALSAAEVQRLNDLRYARAAAAAPTFSAGADLSMGKMYLDNGQFNANIRAVTHASELELYQGTYSGSANTQTLNGGLRVEGGTFSGGSGTVDINGNAIVLSGTLTASSTTTNISGDLTAQGGTFNHNGGAFTFDSGSGTQNLTLDVAVAFNNLTVTAGTTLVEVNAANLASVSGTLTNNHIIRKSQAVTGTGPVNFGLTGIDVDVNTQADIATILVDRYDQTHADPPTWIQENHYWEITATNSGANPASGYNVDLTMPLNGATGAVAQVCRYEGPVADWNCARDSNTSTTVTRNGITQLSEWAIADEELPTPTPTNTVEPPTPTPTNTPEAPTPTATSEPTATSTPEPPTATPTNTPQPPPPTSTPEPVAGNSVSAAGAVILAGLFIGTFWLLLARMRRRNQLG